jgi:hypothetical protein
MTGVIKTDLRTSFIKKHAETCDIASLFNKFCYYTSEDLQGIGYRGDSKWYLCKLLSNFSPKESMPILCPIEGKKFVQNIHEEKYIILMAGMVELLVDNKDYSAAAAWAKIGVDLVNYFHPYLNVITKQTIIEESKAYKYFADIFERYKEYFDQDWYSNYGYFDWQKKFYSPTTHANQNFKYRIGF